LDATTKENGYIIVKSVLERKIFVIIAIIFAIQLTTLFGNVMVVNNIIIEKWNFVIPSLLIAFLVYQNIEKVLKSI
jgi:hypothetical protein